MAQTYRQVAKSVADRKAAHPELYCKARGCLWQTAELNPERNGYILNADPCRKHPELNTEPARKESAPRIAAIEELRSRGFRVIESEGRAIIVIGPQVRFPKALMSDRFDKDTVAVRFGDAESALSTLRKHEQAV